jgi:signal transduction histidine kinase/ActR/RegA family two-component response regulator
MLKQKPVYILTILLLLILGGMSLFFSYTSWQTYQENKRIKSTVENIQVLQKYQTATLNQALCDALIDKNPEKVLAICKNSIGVKKSLLEHISNDENALVWGKKISSIEKNIAKYGVDNFEKVLEGTEIKSPLDGYLNRVLSDIQEAEEKELLAFYAHLYEISYVTELEKFLVSYYVVKKIPLPIENSILWDRIIESSNFLTFDKKMVIDSLKDKVYEIAKTKQLDTVSSKMDEMRITILTGSMDLESPKNIQWIDLLEKKRKAFEMMGSMVYDTIQIKLDDRTNTHFWSFVFFIVLGLLAFIALFTLNMQVKKEIANEQEMEESLLKLVNKMESLSSFDPEKKKNIYKSPKQFQNKDELFTYLGRTYQELLQKCQESQDEIASKSQFLSTLSHEVRTPLNGIIGFLKLLKDMGLSPDQEEFLTLIEKSSSKLILIINDILDLSKINAKKMELEHKSFDIFDMVESTVASFTQQTDHKDIELGLFIDPFLKHHFLGDATKISQILTNLVGNAVKFTAPYGKINIFVQMVHQDKKKAKIKFAVHDDGIGLSKDHMKNIFKAFSQASSDTSKKYGGTGLGLTISYEMVELMGGKLNVESELNKGATFFFTLELEKDNDYVDEPYPQFPKVSVGLALPVRSINRQLDSNLEAYVRHLKASFTYYYYEDLFESDKIIQLPDIMIFDHHYARLVGELEQCASIDCKTVLLTNGALYSRINPERHRFSNILYRPITLKKTIRILKTSEFDEDIQYKPSKELKNISSFQGLNALVADDNAINRKLIKIILEKLGLEVTLTSHGAEVVEAYKTGRFDIIFMDIQMPIMDGVEATHAIIEYEKENDLSHVPIIALTANVGSGDKERYLKEGMDDYATKPLEIDTIKSLISKHSSTELSS